MTFKNIFDNYQTQTGSVLIIGGILFAFQIYGDFSGYSDIAIGVSKLFSIDLIRNFNYPYFSRDIAEFWRRWHMSLTTWFRDYLYIPLGGSRVSKWKVVRNTFLIFIVSGFWHGANWTFISWGVFHAILFLPLTLLKINRDNMGDIAEGRTLPSIKEFYQMLITFVLVTIGWIIFRSETIHSGIGYLKGIVFPQNDFFDVSFLIDGGNVFTSYNVLFSFLSILIMICLEWVNRFKQYGFEISYFSKRMKWILCILLCLFVYISHADSAAFIYFQF